MTLFNDGLRRHDMKTLVTGATGFIGSSLVRELLKDNKEVRVLVRKNSDTRNIADLEVEKVYGDTRDGEAVQAALKGCDTLYHAAALYSFWMPSSKIFYDVNVEGTKTVLGAALKQGIKKVVYTSSIAAVGTYGADRPANEEVEFNLWGIGDHYTRSKHLAELEVMKLYKQGLPVVIVNPSMVIGIRDIKPTPSGKLIIDAINKKMPGYIEGGINVVDVEDVARGHILAADKGKNGERYILGNENMTVSNFFKLVAEVSKVAPPKMKIPYRAAIMLGYGYQFLSHFTRKQPVITIGQVRTGSSYAFFDCSKAVRELGFNQTPIKTTMEKAVSWFRDNGYVKSS
jgi:dihydroflavonol-4-reductase